MEQNENQKDQGLQSKVKELVKPRKLDVSLIKEVESLCGELSNCGHLRRLDGNNVKQDNDILF